MPTTTISKPQKTAVELAEMIRTSLGKPELRVGIFATARGWKARAYPEADETSPRLRALIEQKSEELGEQYDLAE